MAISTTGNDLTGEQRAAVEAKPGYLRIVAGPGSGKTRALTERIRHFVNAGWFQPWQVLAVTFTVKATHEMRNRLRDSLGQQSQHIVIKTLHALALSIVKAAPKKAGLPEAFDIDMPEGRRVSLLDKVLDCLRRDAGFPRDLLDPQCAWHAICHLKHSEPYRLINGDGSPEVELCRAFDTEVRKDRVVLFDDFGVAALRLFQSDREALGMLQRRYRAVFVDEYQDLDATQFYLVKELTAASGVLSVVGDDDQCIYTWRGANPSYLRDFDRYFQAGEAQTVLLEKNHRSTRTIVEAAGALIDNNQLRIPKRMVAVTHEQGARIRLRRFGDLQEEVSQIVDNVLRIIQQGVSPSDVGVLARNNDLVQAFVMQARAEGLPVHAENPLHSSVGVSLLNLLRTVLEGPGDRFFQACVNIGNRRVRKSTFRDLAQGAVVRPEDVEVLLRRWVESSTDDKTSTGPLPSFLQAIDIARKSIETEEPLEVLTQLLDALDCPRAVSGEPEPDQLHAASALALEVARRQGNAIGFDAWSNVLSELDEVRQGSDTFGDAVSVMTVHRSKGLEFGHVFIMGVQGDKFPNLQFAEKDPAIMEAERRLFYVGITRARTSLTLSNHARMIAGSRTGPEKDGFIREIPSYLLQEGD